MTVTAVRTNELLRQLVAKDRDETLVGLTEKSGDVITMSSALVADRIRSLRAYAGSRSPTTSTGWRRCWPGSPSRCCSRPPACPTCGSAAQMDEFARTVIAPMVLRGAP